MIDSPRRKHAPLSVAETPFDLHFDPVYVDDGNHGIMLAILRGLPDADTRNTVRLFDGRLEMLKRWRDGAGIASDGEAICQPV